MTSENTDRQPRAATKFIYRFLGGTALGAFLVGVPISYAPSIHLTAVQAIAASAIAISFGLLTSLWGGKFIDGVMQVLENNVL
ncbi:MAG: hypothetical protein KME17_26455 [Cyanosarcina radialis HA8281-LM2]|jgi:hypothetical protein|nr:hypothetical protein [Cyanosarcina radialis HA8281-LM2]